MPVVPFGAQMIPEYTGPGGATAANVLALVNIGGDFDQATMDAIGLAWYQFWSNFGSDEWAMNDTMECRDLRVDPYAVLDADANGGAGTDTGDPLPPASTVCVSIRAATGGRSGRGRFYLPGVPDSSVTTAGLIDSGLISDTLDDYTDFGIAVATQGWIPAVYSREDVAVRAVVSASISPYIDTQRRRQGRLDV